MSMTFFKISIRNILALFFHLLSVMDDLHHEKTQKKLPPEYSSVLIYHFFPSTPTYFFCLEAFFSCKIYKLDQRRMSKLTGMDE